MAVSTLDCSFDCTARISTTVARDIGGGNAVKHAYNLQSKIEWAFGTAAAQANQVWEDRRTLAAGASENLDLQGGTETSGYGQTLTLSKLLGIWIHITSSNGGPLLIGGAAANAFDALFGDASDKLRVRKLFIDCTDDATGYAVDASDVLKIENEDGSNPVDFDIILLGID